MRNSLLIAGIIIMFSGIFWSLQGLGIIPWPASSFMINQTQWVYYGGITAFIGLIVILYSRRWSQ
ncbi:MAG TPA: hypothetical protein VL360_01965 [Gammaproteobacteria bacterium]|jgi:hypothetical protein|nr:hypothetical protein [Gammaproteobacteria bacterium]